MPEQLTPYRGHDVLSATVSIRNTGDGLSAAMKVDPIEVPIGAKVYVVLECDGEKHRYEGIPDTDAFQLVNMLKAGRATIVDREVVEKYLDDQQRLIDEAAGQIRLPVDADAPEEL